MTLTIQPQVNTYNKQKHQNFNGLGNLLTVGLQACDQYPVVGISVVDMTSTIAPRTIYDAKTAGPAAATETFRKESSGLVVNCLTPGAVALGMGYLANKFIMKDFKNVKMVSSLANQDSLETLGKIFSETKSKSPKSFVLRGLMGLEGFDKNGYVNYADKKFRPVMKKAISIISTEIAHPEHSKSETKKAIQAASKLIADSTKAVETIRFKDKTKTISVGLADFLRDQVDLGRNYQIIKKSTQENAENVAKKLGKSSKELFNKEFPKVLDDFTKASKKLVNTKSLMAFGVILPVAMSVQKINRALTRKKYHVKGAPIYKDFGKDKEQKEPTKEEKHKLFVSKCLASAAMVGLAVTSMMKKPSLKMIQFKGMFPATDQCRVIAAATIVSRFFASEDKNELRESVIKDMTCFAGLYFLGDYVAKGLATGIEKFSKSGVKLINRLKPDDKSAPVLKRLGNWVKNYKLKSFEEVADSKAKNLRSLCQLANIGFAFAVLGVLLPVIGRKTTNKKIAQQKALEESKTQESSKQLQVTSFANKNMPKAFGKIANQM